MSPSGAGPRHAGGSDPWGQLELRLPRLAPLAPPCAVAITVAGWGGRLLQRGPESCRLEPLAPQVVPQAVLRFSEPAFAALLDSGDAEEGARRFAAGQLDLEGDPLQILEVLRWLAGAQEGSP